MATINDVARYPMLIDIANTKTVTRQAKAVSASGAQPRELRCSA
ncbi:hypothetical protein ACIPY3_18465 [Paenarthrobacter sp. NPDC089714]